VKFSPVADENLLVYSCSSERIGLFHFFSVFCPILVTPYFVPDCELGPAPLTPGANLILLGLGGLFPNLLSGEKSYYSVPPFFFLSASNS
jgi:hypothetical protein